MFSFLSSRTVPPKIPKELENTIIQNIDLSIPKNHKFSSEIKKCISVACRNKNEKDQYIEQTCDNALDKELKEVVKEYKDDSAFVECINDATTDFESPSKGGKKRSKTRRNRKTRGKCRKNRKSRCG